MNTETLFLFVLYICIIIGLRSTTNVIDLEHFCLTVDDDITPEYLLERSIKHAIDVLDRIFLNS